MVTADTSFSNDQKWVSVEGEARVAVLPHVPNTPPSPEAGSGTRGHAVSEVVFGVNDSDGSSFTNVHGMLSNGETYDFEIPPATKNLTRCLIGREVCDGWWARVLLSDGKVVLSKGEGFTCTNRVVSMDWAWQQLEQVPINAP